MALVKRWDAICDVCFEAWSSFGATQPLREDIVADVVSCGWRVTRNNGALCPDCRQNKEKSCAR